jgi:hypothetical protein
VDNADIVQRLKAMQLVVMQQVEKCCPGLCQAILRAFLCRSRAAPSAASRLVHTNKGPHCSRSSRPGCSGCSGPGRSSRALAAATSALRPQ